VIDGGADTATDESPPAKRRPGGRRPRRKDSRKQALANTLAARQRKKKRASTGAQEKGRQRVLRRCPKQTKARTFKRLPEQLQARRAAFKRLSVIGRKLHIDAKKRPPKSLIPRLAVLVQATGDDRALTTTQQARAIARFLRACKFETFKAERIEAREQRRKARVAKEDLRKAVIGMQADDLKAGRPAVGNRYQFLKPKG
jgi:hypothetical protein